MVASFLSDLTGGIANTLFNQAGVSNSTALQKDLMKYQAKLNYNYSQKDLKNKWTANRQGLEKAGYNPMLALSGVSSNSSWASPQSVSDTGTGTSFGTGISNAIQSRQLAQQGNLIQSQIENNNADSVLKEQQAITETYDQLQKQVHTDLEDIEGQLKQKDLSTYDRRWLLEQKRINQEIESMNVQNKVGLTKATAEMLQARNGLINANANARDVDSRIEQRKYQNNGLDLDNMYKGLWLSPGFNPNLYNFTLSGMQKHGYK